MLLGERKAFLPQRGSTKLERRSRTEGLRWERTFHDQTQVTETVILCLFNKCRASVFTHLPKLMVGVELRTELRVDTFLH